jgi:hypothetical protein
MNNNEEEQCCDEIQVKPLQPIIPEPQQVDRLAEFK